jgi:hypothetical protein
VCNEEGNVIGVISIGLESTIDNPYRYAASIVGMAELSVNLPNPDGSFSSFSVQQLSQLGLIMHPSDFSVGYSRSTEGLKVFWPDDQ